MKRGELAAVAEEWYFELPNGLKGNYLNQAKDGKRQDTAPDFIGHISDPDYGGTDGRIHPDLTCDACHAAQVLKPIRDWVRLNFDSPQHLLQSPDYELEKAFNREFFRSLEEKRSEDAAHWIKNMQDVSGLQIGKLIEADNKRWEEYAETPLDADAFGRLLGYSGKDLVAGLKAYNAANHGIRPVFFPLIRDDKGFINRRTAEEQIPVAQAIMRDYTP